MYGGAGAGGGAARDEEEDSVVFEEVLEFLSGSGGVFIGDGEHGAVAGFFHV